MFFVGWKSTFESYYASYTKQILDLMLKYLSLHRNLTFVWPEVVFLQKWYEDLTKEERDDFRKYVATACLHFRVHYQKNCKIVFFVFL